MGLPVPIAELAYREYLSTGECARLFGRGTQWWQEAFDGGHLEGYRDGTKRFINAASARAHLKQIGTQQRIQPGATIGRQPWVREMMRQFRMGNNRAEG
jgi:hypothetical protein